MGRGKWGQGWSAAQVREWFSKYAPIVVRYAELAQESGCDAFHVGHELHSLLTDARNEAHWRSLIGQVRAVYKGKVSARPDKARVSFCASFHA